MERLCHDPVIGDYILVKSKRVSRISIRVSPVKGVVVTIPYWAPYRLGSAFLAVRRNWVAACLKKQEDMRQKAVSEGKMPSPDTDLEALVASLRKEAKAYLPHRLAFWAERYGFEYGKVFIKHNLSNWGSCSAKKNINLNLNLMRLDEPLRDYVMLHELCHLRHPNHGPAFHTLLDSLCRDALGRPARELEKEVKSYRLI